MSRPLQLRPVLLAIVTLCGLVVPEAQAQASPDAEDPLGTAASTSPNETGPAPTTSPNTAEAGGVAFEENEELQEPGGNVFAEFFKNDVWGTAEELGSSWKFAFDDYRIRYSWQNLFKTNTWIDVPVEFEETRLKGSIGARARFDATAFSRNNELPGFHNAAELRSVRLFTEGSYLLGLPTDYRFEFALESGEFVLTEFFLWFKQIPFADNVKVGNFKAPLGMERLTSSYSESFMEISGPTEAFTPGYKFGLENRYTSESKDLAFAIGIFGDTQNSINVGDATKSLARLISRAYWLPAFQPDREKECLTHLGLSGSLLFSNQESVRFKSRPESNLAPVVIDTGEIIAQKSAAFGVEAAHLLGPLLLRVEFLGAYVNQNDPTVTERDLFFWGTYFRAGYFLTGEVRRYNLDRGIFTKPAPKETFSLKNGLFSGAWEVAGRVSYTDLEDGNIQGGEMVALNAGLNWYWTRNVRWMFNGIYADFRDGPISGSTGIAQVRFELDF